MSAAQDATAETKLWCQPGDIAARMFVVRFDDQDMTDAVFDNEHEARDYWKRASTKYNCYLFGAMPVTPAAEAAEQEIAALKKKLQDAKDLMDEFSLEVNQDRFGARKSLAERDAEIANINARLATARRDALLEAGDIAEETWLAGCPVAEIADVIRAAAAAVKTEGA